MKTLVYSLTVIILFCTHKLHASAKDSLILVEFHNANGGSITCGLFNFGWDLNQPMDTWCGVYLDSSRCVKNLILDNQGISVITDDIGELKALTKLDLRQNQISVFPLSLTTLDSLSYLDLSNNDIHWIPSEISNLSTLNYLALHKNELTVVPESIYLLSNLETLTLNSNKLIQLPDSIGNMANLITLQLQHNQLTTLPESMWNLVTNINVEYNLLTFDVIEQLVNNSTPLSIDYAPQDTIPTFRLDSSLFVQVGGTIANNTFAWYKDDLLFTTNIGDSVITPTGTGDYYCEITNSVAPNLTLISDSYYFQSDSTVMPGDADNNGFVNALDVLYIGTAYGTLGFDRSNPSTTWIPQSAGNWTTDVYGVNGKHQDCDGSGTIDDGDFDAVDTNFDSTSIEGLVKVILPPPTPFSPNNTSSFNPDEPVEPSPFKLNTILVADSTYSLNNQIFRQTTLDLYIEHDTIPMIDSVNGVAITIEHLPTVVNLNMYADLTNSALGSTSNLRKVERFDTLNARLDIGIFNVDSTVILNGPVMQIIIEEMLAGKNGGTGNTLANICNVYLSQNDTIVPVIGQTLYQSTADTTGVNKNPTGIKAMATVSHPTCEQQGSITVWAIPNVKYTYDWSTGDTSKTVNHVPPGGLDVLISNTNQDTVIIEMNVSQPVYCDDRVEPSVKLFLEGAVDTTSWLLSDQLRRNNLIPQISPYTVFGEISPELLLLQGELAIADWVQVEVREKDNPSQCLDRRAALIRRNGELVSTNGHSPVQLFTYGQDSVHLVIHHRNHLPVLHGPFNSVEPLIVDFTLQNSTSLGLGVSQKQLAGHWMLIVGDINTDRSIDGLDRYLWSKQNGNFLQYLNADLNFDGEVSGADKLFWIQNNGLFSDIR